MDKRKVQKLLDAEADDVDLDAFLDKLGLLAKLDTSEKELAAGKGIDHSEVQQRVGKWLK